MDRVTPEVHDAVLKRDGCCIISRIDATHVCRDRWGNPHASTDLARLTLDHVHDVGSVMGKRAPSDEFHLVAMCAKTNIDGPNRAIRLAEREYLRSIQDSSSGKTTGSEPVNGGSTPSS